MSSTTSLPAPAPTHPDGGVGHDTPWDYTPTESVCIIFVVLYAISLALHMGAAYKYRLWWLLPTVVLGCLGEVIGWAGRLWSHFDIDAHDPFEMQITCTIIAPTPFVAAVFITFGQLVRRLGERYSWLSYKTYAKVFLTVDIISLIVQGVGGGIASSADTDKGADLGGNIMLAGIVIQMVALFSFMALAAQFYFCYARNRPVRGKTDELDVNSVAYEVYNWNTKFMLLSGAMGFITLVLMIRAVYRTIELANGWNGPVISVEKWFNIFDGTMVVLAVYTFIIFHPGYLLFSQKPTVGTVTVAVDDKEVKGSPELP